MQSSVAVRTESDAWAMLSDQRFLADWQELFEACTWSTTFQSPSFICTWFEHYKRLYSPVLVVQETGKRINALLVLGHSVSTHKLIVAGGYQAEYQVWLEQPDESNDFFRQAFEAIAIAYPGYDLTFKYLPKDAPIKQFHGSGRLHQRIGVMAYSRLYTLLDQKSLDQIFSNKRNQRSIKNLRKLGLVEFKRIFDTGQLDSIFDEIIAFYDFRQGAVHDRSPFFHDASKQAFHLELLKKHPDLLHVTVTILNGKILAAHIGIISKNQVHLGIIAYSPFYVHYAPGIVHLMLLCELLFHEGITHLDLTPGSDPTKERFANGCDQVNLLKLHRDRQAYTVATLKVNGINFIKSLSRYIGLSDDKAQAIYERAKRFCFREAVLQISRFFWRKSELQVYRYFNKRLASSSAYGSLNKDLLCDLVKYEPINQLSSKQALLLEAMKRLGQNEHFYTLVVEERLVFCSWLSLHAKECFLSEVQQTFPIQNSSAVLEITHINTGSLSLDLFQDVMDRILFDVQGANQDKQILIVASGHNPLVRRAFDSLGLEYLGSLHLQRLLGVTRRWRSNDPIQSKWLITPFTRDV